MREAFPLGAEPVGEEQQADFIKTFGAILRLRNVFIALDRFEGTDGQPGDGPVDPRTLQDYQSVFVDLYHELRGRNKGELDDIVADLTFEIELVRQAEVNVGYTEEWHPEPPKPEPRYRPHQIGGTAACYCL